MNGFSYKLKVYLVPFTMRVLRECLKIGCLKIVIQRVNGVVKNNHE